MKKKQLSHPEYYRFRKWIEETGEQNTYKHTSQELADQATKELKFDVPVSAVAATLKELGWNKRKPGGKASAENEAIMQLLTGFEFRLANNENAIAELFKRLQPSKQ